MLTKTMHHLRALVHDRDGVASVEYGVLAAGVITAVVAAMIVFSSALTTAYGVLAAAIEAAF